MRPPGARSVASAQIRARTRPMNRVSRIIGGSFVGPKPDHPLSPADDVAEPDDDGLSAGRDAERALHEALRRRPGEPDEGRGSGPGVPESPQSRAGCRADEDDGREIPEEALGGRAGPLQGPGAAVLP